MGRARGNKRKRVVQKDNEPRKRRAPAGSDDEGGRSASEAADPSRSSPDIEEITPDNIDDENHEKKAAFEKRWKTSERTNEEVLGTSCYLVY